MARFNAVFERQGDTQIRFKITSQTKEFYYEDYLEKVNAYLASEGFDLQLISYSCPELSFGDRTFFLRGSDRSMNKEWATSYYGRETPSIDMKVVELNRMVLAIQEFTRGEGAIKSPIERKIASLDRRFKAGLLRKTAETVDVLPLGA